MIASLGKILSSAHGVAYYERDGHHARNDPAHRQASAWAGKGAAALGVAGPVEPAAFKAVLEGRVPDRPRLGRRDRHGNVFHRPGRDLTLSAPKSVSLLALAGGDERIVAAHEGAVRTALEWVERNAVETRLKDPATGAIVRAGGQDMVAATFRHDTSRNLDPQLHTHCVIANMVRGPDGKWRTMVNDGLYNSKAAIGAIYRAELARGLTALGYLIDSTRSKGRFEIAGVPRDVIRAFSTRRAEIEAALADRGPKGLGSRPGLAGLAALVTRRRKRDKTREESRRAWSLRAEELGFDPVGLVAEAKARRAGAGETVAWAARSLGERDVVFSHAALLITALGRAPGAVTVGEAESAVQAMRGDGRLYPAEGFRRGPHWTYDPAIAAESESIAWMRAGLGAAGSILRRRTAAALLRGSGLFRKHREAILFVLSALDRVIGLQGWEGTGRAAMLRRLRAVARTAACRVTGLAPSDAASSALARHAGIESEPLPRFLARHAALAAGQVGATVLRRLRASFHRTLQVVDGASLVSTAQMRDLLKVTAALRIARLVLLGDGRRAGDAEGAERGRPFAQLARAGMPVAVMEDADRRREAEWREAARSRLLDAVRAAFAQVGDRVSESPLERLAVAVAALWLAPSAAEREATEVIAQAPALRHEINEAIRCGLVREGSVHGPARQGARLASRDLGRAALAEPESYAPGDTVVFLRPYKRLGVRKGDERTVSEVDAEASVVRLADGRGRTRDWKPGSLAARAGGVELFRSEPLELRAGDRVRWTRDDTASALRAGRGAHVEAIASGRVRFRLAGGVAVELADADPQLRRLERAWASPPGAPQVRVAKNLVAAVGTGDPRLATRESLYAAVGDVPGTARLVTDDAGRLADLLEAAVGERVEALEAVARNRSPA